MFEHEFYNGRWGITFLVTDGHLDEFERLELLVHATEMYLNQEPERMVEVEGRYKGLIKTGRCEGLGIFFGRRYDAELKVWDENGENLETAKLRFLVQEMSKANYN